MSSSKCARCDQTVYPVEGLRCLDKIWHKGCFKCQECNMTLSLKNYKGFEKRPYCNAHCPQAKATTVADTPEIRRLAENTRIQSQAKYHEDFEKSKGKGFTAIADDPETLRIKNTSKIISNVAYHGELERKKQMEEKRVQSGPEEVLNNNNNNNNNNKHQNRMQQHSVPPLEHEADYHSKPANNYHIHNQYQHPGQQQMHQQQQLHLQAQQQQLHQKQQQQQMQQQQINKQQMLYAQDLNGQPVINRQVSQIDGHLHQQPTAKHVQQQQQYTIGHPQQQQQQQFITRQQQQHQIMLQQQRQSMEINMPMSRQAPKQQLSNSNNNLSQQIIKHQIIPPQQQQQVPMKYMSINEAPRHHPSPSHIIGPQGVIAPSQIGGIPNSQRVAPNGALVAGPQAPHHMIHGFNQHQIGNMNGVMPKQSQFVYSQPRHMIHPSQIQQMNIQQIRPHPQQMQQMPQQVPRGSQRVFRAMYDYVANDVDEVSFFENDILVDCVNVDGNWLIGKVARSGQTGMLPANYVAEFTSQ